MRYGKARRGRGFKRRIDGSSSSSRKGQRHGRINNGERGRCGREKQEKRKREKKKRETGLKSSRNNKRTWRVNFRREKNGSGRIALLVIVLGRVCQLVLGLVRVASRRRGRTPSWVMVGMVQVVRPAGVVLLGHHPLGRLDGRLQQVLPHPTALRDRKDHNDILL